MAIVLVEGAALGACSRDWEFLDAGAHADAAGLDGTSSDGPPRSDSAAPGDTTDAATMGADVPGSDRSPPATSGCRVDDKFGPPDLVAELSTSDHDLGLRLSADGTAYFTRAPLAPDVGNPPYTYADLYVADVAPDGGFGPASILSPPSVSGETGDLNPTLTADGLTLFFDSYRPYRAIFLSNRSDAGAIFSDAAMVVFFGDSEEFEPYITPDGSAIYFVSGHIIDGGPSLPHIWRASLQGNQIAAIGAVTLGAYLDRQRAPVVSPDETAIYYTGIGIGGGSQEDMYLATRASANDPFGPARRLDEINSLGADHPSFITADGCDFYFSSDRVGGAGGWDIYHAQRPRPDAGDGP